MGNGVIKSFVLDIATIVDDISDRRYAVNYMEDGGCGQKYLRALHDCHPAEASKRRRRGDAGDGISDEECARATQALLKCMKLRPDHFRAYIPRIEGGLDQDQRPEEKVSSRWPDDFVYSHRWRWWDGMRRS